jgi:hypothetical protein
MEDKGNGRQVTVERGHLHSRLMFQGKIDELRIHDHAFTRTRKWRR